MYEVEEEYMDQEGYGGEGEPVGEFPINIPPDEDYPGFDEYGLTEDTIRVVHDFVHNNGHLQISPEEVAGMLEQDTQEAVDIAAMVLDVWRNRNPQLEGGEEIMEQPPPEPEDDPYVPQTSGVMEERQFSSDRRPSGSIEGRQYSSDRRPSAGTENRQYSFDRRPSGSNQEPEVIRQSSSQMGIIRQSSAPAPEPVSEVIPASASGASPLKTRPITEVSSGPRPTEVSITIPPGDDYAGMPQSSVLKDIDRVVRNFVIDTSSVGITATDIVQELGLQDSASFDLACKVVDIWRLRNPDVPLQPPVKYTYRVTAESPVRSRPVNAMTTTPKTVELPVCAGSGPLTIPPDVAYTFDNSGLTEDAIRIVQAYVTETGSLGISSELVAAEMVDIMGKKKPESLYIASQVLGIWRSYNPHIPLVAAHQQYRAADEPAPEVVSVLEVIQPESAGEPVVYKPVVAEPLVYKPPEAAPPAPVTSVTSITSVTSAVSGVVAVREQAPAAPIAPAKTSSQLVVDQRSKAPSQNYTVGDDDYVFVEREDAWEDVYDHDLAYLLEPLGCTVESTVHPKAGPVVIFKTLSTKSTLYKSGVEPGDILFSLDGNTITKTAQLYTALSRYMPGSPCMLKVRRLGPLDDTKEWSVVLVIPVRKTRRVIDPCWAGLPPSKPYRSYSGLLPTDYGFAERYAQVPSYIATSPNPLLTNRYWDTRVVPVRGCAPCIGEGTRHISVVPEPRVRLVETVPAPICAPCARAPDSVDYIRPAPGSYANVVSSMVRKYQACNPPLAIEERIPVTTVVPTSCGIAIQPRGCASPVVQACSPVMRSRYRRGYPMAEVPLTAVVPSVVGSRVVRRPPYPPAVVEPLPYAEPSYIVPAPRYVGRPSVLSAPVYSTPSTAAAPVIRPQCSTCEAAPYAFAPYGRHRLL